MEGRGAIAVGVGCIIGCTGGHEVLGELGNRVVARWLGLLVLLGESKLLADLNRYGFILTNPSEQNFLRAGLGIEVPCAVL